MRRSGGRAARGGFGAGAGGRAARGGFGAAADERAARGGFGAGAGGRTTGRVRGAWRPALVLTGAAALVVVGGLIDSATLFTLAVGLLLVAVSGFAWTAAAVRRLTVTRTIAVGEVIEGQPLRVALTLSGIGRLPVRVEARDADGRWIALPPDGGTLELRVPRRGAHLIAPTQLRISDDLAVVRRMIAVGEPHPLLVLPAMLPGHVALPGGARGRTHDPEPDGLRAYRPGTPANRIHWASLARGGELQERVMTTATGGLPLVVVDTAAASDAAAVDWAARAAAGTVRELVAHGGCRVSLPGRAGTLSVTAAGGWPAVHRALAHMGVGAADAAGPTAAGGPVLRIDAATAPADHPRAALPAGILAA